MAVKDIGCTVSPSLKLSRGVQRATLPTYKKLHPYKGLATGCPKLWHRPFHAMANWIVVCIVAAKGLLTL